MHFALNGNSVKTRNSAETGSQLSDLQAGCRTESLEFTEMLSWVKDLIFLGISGAKS